MYCRGKVSASKPLGGEMGAGRRSQISVKPKKNVKKRAEKKLIYMDNICSAWNGLF